MRRWILISLVLLAACSDSRTEEILVSSAASLTDVFAEIETAFEQANPGLDVVLNFGGSSALREQILAGAPSDVFASANMENMDVVTAAGYVDNGAVVFAKNQLEIAVPLGNPGAVIGLGDFSRPGLLIGLCAAAVPCGDLALEALSNAGVDPAVDTNEPNVRALLTKIAAGELDAGIVYATDLAVRTGTVVGISIPGVYNVEAEYPIAVLNGGNNPAGAAAFVGFVTSTRGRSILAEYGFVLP